MLSCSVGNGSVVNVDFQGPGGQTVVGSGVLGGGTVWNVNGEGFGAEVPLVTSTGVSSGLVLWSSGFTGTRAEGDALYHDYFVGEVEVRGLLANHAYELVLHNAANILPAYNFPGSWQPTGASADPHFVGTYGIPSLPGVEGCDYLRGIAVTDSEGVLAFSAGFGALAGLQLDLPQVASPEPSMALLQSLGFAVLVLRRRRG